MEQFHLGQIVKQAYGAVAHYAIVVAENRTIGWVNTSKLEVKPIDGEGWQTVDIKGESFDFETIKANIKTFKEALENKQARPYHVTEFNCEHWATLMVTGKAYSTQSGSLKFGTAEIVGGAMVGIGASAGTVITIASTLGAAASTGTAIGSLSGAAATNAALAWLGGGTLAVGGGGMAAGAAIVSTVATGGAVVAIAGVGLLGHQLWKNRVGKNFKELCAELLSHQQNQETSSTMQSNQTPQKNDPLGEIRVLWDKIQPEYNQTLAEVESWQNVAKEAVKRGRDDLAKAAIQRKQQYQQKAQTLQEQLQKLVTMTETVLRNRYKIQ